MSTEPDPMPASRRTAAQLRRALQPPPKAAPGPFAHMNNAIVRALLPPPRPVAVGLPPVPHDAQATKDAAEAKRQRRRERNRKVAGHG